jgi:hypothetical protein
MAEHSPEAIREGKRVKWFTTVWVSIEFISVQIADAIMDYLWIIRRELELFSGTALVLVGLLHWSSSKYCDGNTADYLSCTNPVTYYYYDAFEITIIVLGAFLVMIWFLKNRKSK